MSSTSIANPTSRVVKIAALIALPVLALALLLAYPVLESAYRDFIAFIFSEQRSHHKSMTENLSTFADSGGWAAIGAVVLGSFLYGIFHAAGPGHGKVVVSTYLLTQPENVAKGIRLSVAAAMLQGAVAIVLVYGAFYLFGLVGPDTKGAVQWSERLAFLMVIGIGLSLIWRAFRASKLFTKKASHDNHHGHDHAHHDHDHVHSHAHDHSHGHGDHHHHHAEGEVCSTCGHAHAPNAEQLEQANDWRSQLGVIASIGMRPCSGAILVLVFAKFASIPLAGIAAVIAMSIGTAITVSSLAYLTVKARAFTMRYVDTIGGTAQHASTLIALAGGVMLVLIGYGLLQASFEAPVRSMGL